jgi:hypothetical protein
MLCRYFGEILYHISKLGVNTAEMIDALLKSLDKLLYLEICRRKQLDSEYSAYSCVSVDKL